MTDPTTAFASMVPGFDFLQGLVKNAGAAVPGVGHWVAPTLDPDELEKRIEELKTVQFWLEQNARMLGATIQAMEVQRMTLSTLKTMNLSFGDLTESLKIKLPETAAPASSGWAMPAATPAPSHAPAAPVASAPEAEAPPPAAAAPRPKATPTAGTPGAATPGVPAGVVDPLQWWGALTQQFTELATKAMAEGQLRPDEMMKRGLEAASAGMRQAASGQPAPAKSTKGAAKTAAAKAAPASAAAGQSKPRRPGAAASQRRKTAARSP